MASRIQSQTTAVVVLAPETAWGVPATTGFREANRVTWTVNLKQDSYASKRIRSDAQVAYLRLGMRSLSGSYEDELSIGGSDTFLAAVARASWAAGPTFNGSVSTGAAPLNSITRSTGSWINDGFAPGQIVTLSGLSDNAADIETLVTTVTDTALGVSVALDTESGVSVTVSVVGKLVQNGTLNPSFTAELQFPDLATPEYIVQSGIMVTGASFTLAPNGLASISYDVLGKDEALPSITSIAGAFLQPEIGDLLTTPAANVYVNGIQVELFSSFTMKIDTAANVRGVLGSKSIANISKGQMQVTGDLEFLLEDTSLIAAFNAEQPISILIQLLASNGTDFLAISLPNVKLTTMTHDLTGEQEVIVKSSYQALMHPTFLHTIAFQSTAPNVA